MEQLYLVEIFIDKVTIFAEEEDSSANKNLIIKIKFGPKVQFIIKEGQLAKNEDENKDDIIECDAEGHRKWTRTIRVGKSYLFPSYPDTVLLILSKFPLEIEVWNDDEKEVQIYVGVGTMRWDTEFFHMLKETADANKLHEPLAIKQRTRLMGECGCKQVGEISFILRLSALGDSIITEFQQIMKDPENFVFRTNKAPSMFQCKRVEGDNPNFCMAGSLYETATLEDPDLSSNAQKKIEVCTELQSCGIVGQTGGVICEHSDESPPKKSYEIDKIKMGDIRGPCGNTNCALAHKVKMYIRNLDSYKKQAGSITQTKDPDNRRCGACSCKDDRWHREDCPDNKGEKGEAVCKGCGGITKKGDTCGDRKKKLQGTGVTPISSKTTVAYVLNLTKDEPDFKQSMFGRNYTIQNLSQDYHLNFPEQPISSNKIKTSKPSGSCCCQNSEISPQGTVSDTCLANDKFTESKSTHIDFKNQQVYNVSLNKSKVAVFNCTEIPEDKDCKCSPPKPTPPCKTFDCDCLIESVNIASRKAHKAYCPLFRHKSACPVTLMNEEEEKKNDDDEDEAEPLPYGLPPIKLGPCPVLGRPCSVPDGFARMYKTAAIAVQPPSWSDAGKICCSKEFERIKKAIKDYMKYEREHDFRCINKFNVDTERRCCDKEQVLMSLTGRGCCGSHKLAIQEKYKEEK